MVYIMNIMITRFHRAAAYKLTRRLHIQVGYLFFLSFFFFFFFFGLLLLYCCGFCCLFVVVLLLVLGIGVFVCLMLF